MVLTNFECWANDSSSDRSIIFGDNLLDHRSERVNLFTPAATMELCNNNNYSADERPPKIVSHLSSNGYYGFVQLCNVEAATNDASGGGIDDVNIANTCMMDIEQQNHMNELPHMPVLSTTAAAVGLKYSKNPSYDGCCLHRRKRNYDGQQVIHNAKRFCCDIKADQQNVLANDGSTIESFTLDTYQQNKIKMDHDDFSAVAENDANKNRHQQQSINFSSISVPLTAKVPETHQNYKGSNVTGCESLFVPYCKVNNNYLMLSPPNTKTILDYKTKNTDILNVIDETNQNKNYFKKPVTNALSDDDHYDDHLECLFWSIHGGSDRQLWQHLSSDFINNDI